MSDTINGKTPDEIKKGLECCLENRTCNGCPYYVPLTGGECLINLRADSLALIRQQEQQLAERDARIAELERERDAAVEQLVKFEHPIPCESDELALSEYCEKHCSFRTPQKECWMEYFSRRGVQEVE